MRKKDEMTGIMYDPDSDALLDHTSELAEEEYVEELEATLLSTIDDLHNFKSLSAIIALIIDRFVE